MKRCLCLLLPLALSASALFAAPTVDGVVSPDEWKQGAAHLGLMTADGACFPSLVRVRTLRDAKTAYVAVESAVPKRGILRRVMKDAPGGLAGLDDAVLIKLADGRIVSVNALGAVSVCGAGGGLIEAALPCGGGGGGTCALPKGLKTASTVTNGWWTFEASLPLAEIGDLDKLDIGRHFAWAEDKRATDAFVKAGRSLFPADGAPVVQFTELEGGTAAYRLAGSVTNPSDKPQRYRLELRARPDSSQPAALVRDFKLAPGAVEPFELKGAILGDEELKVVGAGRTWLLRPNSERDPFVSDDSAAECVRCRFAYYPSYNRLHLDINVAGVPDWKRDVKGVRAEIIDGAGKEAWSQTFAPDAKGVVEKIIEVPDLRPLTVRGGDPEYRLRVKVEGVGVKGVAYEKRFYRHAMDWEGNKYGLSDIVVPPFTAINVSGGERKPCRSGEDAEGIRVKTLLREHELSSIGLFRQVRCPAKEGDLEPTRPILADGGMKLVATIGGKAVELKGRLAVERSENPVKRRWTAAIDQDGVKGRVSALFEYDGQLDWRLTLERGSFEALKLVIPLRPGEARLFHAVADTQGVNEAGAIPAGTGRVWDSRRAPARREIIGTFLPYVWIGGPLRGFSCYADSDKGWELGTARPESAPYPANASTVRAARPESAPYPANASTVGGALRAPRNLDFPCFEIVRSPDGTVSLVANLGQRPFEVTEPRTIRLGFMATPVKPMRENWRSWSVGDFVGAGVCWGAGPIDADVQPFDGTTEFWEKFAEARDTGKIDEKYLADAVSRCPYPGKPGDKAYEDRRKSIDHHFRAGMRQAAREGRKTASVWYTNARGVDYGIPSGTTYCDEWNRNAFMDMDRDFNRFSHRDYALDPVASFRDYAAWWYRLMIKTRACDRLYWDVVQPKPNFDLVGTEAYRMPDGRIQGSEGMFNMRELVKRCATVQAELGADATGNWIHMTNTAIAPNSTFAGVHYDLEDEVAPHAFQEKYPRELLQASVIGRQFGVKVGLMAYFSAQSKEKSAWYQRTGAGMVLTHELSWRWNSYVWQKVHKDLVAWGYRSPAVRVWNYWNEDEPYPLTVEGIDKTASIVMLKDDGTVRIVVSDYAGKGGVVRLKPDWDVLQTNPAASSRPPYQTGVVGGDPRAPRAGAAAVGGALRAPRADAFDAECGAALPFKDGAVTVTLKPFDFAVVGFGKEAK